MRHACLLLIDLIRILMLYRDHFESILQKATTICGSFQKRHRCLYCSFTYRSFYGWARLSREIDCFVATLKSHRFIILRWHKNHVFDGYGIWRYSNSSLALQKLSMRGKKLLFKFQLTGGQEQRCGTEQVLSSRFHTNRWNDWKIPKWSTYKWIHRLRRAQR